MHRGTHTSWAGCAVRSQQPLLILFFLTGDALKVFHFLACFLPGSSFTFITTTPNAVQVHRSVANEESRLDGFRQQKSVWELEERRRKKPAWGSTASREQCWKQSSCQRKAGDSSARDWLAESQGEKQWQQTGRWGQGYCKGPWRGKRKNTGIFASIKGACEDRKEQDSAQSSAQIPRQAPDSSVPPASHWTNGQRKGRVSVGLETCFCKPAPNTTREQALTGDLGHDFARLQ